MRLEYVILNDRVNVFEKSKVAIRIADSKGIIDKNHKITGIVYRSQDPSVGEEITFEQYCALDKPEYIGKREYGSISNLPEVLYPIDFPPKKFD